MTARFPRALRNGDTIGVTAFSTGVEARLFPRLEHIVSHLKDRGYRVDEGQCLRRSMPSIQADKGASASALERASELNELLHDPRVAAIAPVGRRARDSSTATDRLCGTAPHRTQVVVWLLRRQHPTDAADIVFGVGNVALLEPDGPVCRTAGSTDQNRVQRAHR